jgi:regulator of sigma E protease
MTLIYAIILLGILIFVHELGHFIFAKLMKVKVEKFSLGFGPRLLGFTYGETEYVISAVPLGGYVKMLGESQYGEETEPLSEEDQRRAYNRQPVRKRFPIVFAGAFFNIAFAYLLYVLIFMTGVPLPNPDIGEVMEGSPAREAGLREGDRVLEVAGKPVETFVDVLEAAHENPGKPLAFRLRRGDETIELTIVPEEKTWEDVFGRQVTGGSIGVRQFMSPEIGVVLKGSPAEEAGLKEGDMIVRVASTAIDRWDEMSGIIHESPGKPIRFVVLRGEESLEFTITPELKTITEPTGKETRIGLIGIRPAGNNFIKRYGPVSAVVLGVEETVRVSGLTVVAIVKLIQRVIPAKTIGGPILIAQMAGQQASKGALNFFTFMAVISVNLGIINLLPIPVLDGGHLVFLVIEVIRKKPVSERAMQLAQRFGLVLILMLMAFAIYNDILRVITGGVIP